MKEYFKHTFADLKSGLVVFLVAIPLCLGIALGSGVPAFSGIIAGIVGGIVVGLVSNSRVGVSGPAAGLIAIILGAMITFKGQAAEANPEMAEAGVALIALQMLAFSVLIAGVIQLILGFAKAGFIAYYFPNVVIKGMLAAIGLILIKKQLTHGLGYDKDALGDMYNSGGEGISFFQEIWAIISDPSLISGTIVCITLISLAILILWETKFIKKSFLGNIPGAVIVVVLGILYTYFMQLGPELIGADELAMMKSDFSSDQLAVLNNYFHETGIYTVDADNLAVINQQLVDAGQSNLGEGQIAALNSMLDEKAALAISAEHRVNLGVQGKEIGDLFAFPVFTEFGNLQIWITGITIAIVASIETLLCVEATDKLDPEKHVTNPNRELIAQGSGNVVAGLLGGLPITQVIVRSSANIGSGVKTKMAAVYHGLFIVVCVAVIPHILNLVPFASLSAILFMVGYKLAKPALFKVIFKRGWVEFIPFIATIAGILATDLLKGIGIGLVVSVFFILYNNFKASHYVEKEEVDGESKFVIHLTENMTFLNKASLNSELDKIPAGSKVLIDKSRVVHLSNDIIEIIEEFIGRAKNENISVEFKGQSTISQSFEKIDLSNLITD